MLSVQFFLPSLAYLAACTALISFFFRDTSQKRKNLSFVLFTCLGLFCLLYALEIQSQPENYYRILQARRHSNNYNLRQAYKKVSLKLHPDKNQKPQASAEFQNINYIIDILMDEKQRDLYNRFGPEHVDADPRLDEFTFIIQVFAEFLMWGLITFVATIPRGARGCRTWIILCILGIAAISICIQFSDFDMPNLDGFGDFIGSATEFEFVLGLNRMIPLIIICFVILSEYFHIDIEDFTVTVLDSVLQFQTEMEGLLNDFQRVRKAGNESNNEELVLVEQRLQKFSEKMTISNQHIGEAICTLRNCSANIGENYHWLIFVVLYGGAFLVGSMSS